MRVVGVLAATWALAGVAAAQAPKTGAQLSKKAQAAAATTPEGDAKRVAGARAPVSEWDDAINAFKYQDFDRAIPRLRKLIYPTPRLERAREWRAREYLAASLWWSGKKQLALDEFTALLVRNPGTRLDPAYYPPQMIKDFEQLRANLIRLGVIKRGQKPTPLTVDPAGKPAPFALTLFPFGVGQFANHEPLKGALFLSAQAALAGVSSALYLYNRDLGVQGRRSDNARVGQVATGGVFWAVAAWGVVDAILGRRRIAAEIARKRKPYVP